MYIDPKFVKKFLVLIFVIAGLFVGYQIMSTDEAEEVISGSLGVDEISDSEKLEYIESEGLGDSGNGTGATFEAGIDAGVDTGLLKGLDDDQYGNRIQFNNSFEHTKPGEYSEVVVEASGFEPGEFTIVYVRKSGTEEYIEAGGQEHAADENGNISARFIITQYGDYEVFLSSQGESITSPTIVVE